MTEKVRQVLDLLRRDRLTWEEVQALLVALEPRLQLSEAQRSLLNSLLGQAELPTVQVAQHLLVMCGANSAALPGTALTAEPLPAEAISPLREAVCAPLREPDAVLPAAPRVLNVTLLSEGVVAHQANVPLSLLSQLDKLLPARGKQVLQASGFSVDTIGLLVEGGAPLGELFSTQDESGTTLQFTLR